MNEIGNETTVPGLFLIENFLTVEEEDRIIQELSEAPWLENRNKSHFVQVYGPFHDDQYMILKHAPITPFLPFMKPLISKIALYHKQQLGSNVPLSKNLGDENKTEIFVHDYCAGNTLPYHIDHYKSYEEVIYGISLLSSSTFSFKRKNQIIDVVLPRLSLYFMTGCARYKFQHGFPVLTERRISLTIRTVNEQFMK